MDRRMAYRRCLLGAFAALATTCLFSVATAQHAAPTAAIVGRLVDVESHAPISRARIAILGARHDFPADSEGRFVESHLASGTYVVQVRALGYGVGSWLVQLGDGETLTRLFELERLPYVLEPVVVQARRRLGDERLQQFERRRAAGGGYFITAAQIEAAHPRALVDLLRTVPGVQMICAGASHCTVRMLRTPRPCAAGYVVDGFPASNSTSPDMAAVGIVGIEVYRSLSETPQQFLGSDNVCGTVVIWTRSGPSDP
jgi:hypothetical protein